MFLVRDFADLGPQNRQIYVLLFFFADLRTQSLKLCPFPCGFEGRFPTTYLKVVL